MTLPGLTSEQVLLADSARRFLERESANAASGSSAAATSSEAERWRAMADMGWLGVGLPEDAGGSGGPVETMMLMEAFGRALDASGFLSSVVLAGRLVARLAQEDQRNDLLRPLIAGSHRYAFAAAEGPRNALHEIATTATPNTGGYVLRGREPVVLDACEADTLIVLARTRGATEDREGLSLFRVPARASGLELRAYRTYDGRSAADLVLTDVGVDDGARLGEEGAAWSAVEWAVDHALVALCAEALGAMAGAHDLTLDYLKTRKQFGRAIGSFQVLQHRMVDVHVAMEESRSLVLAASIDLSRSQPVRRRTVAAAKIFVGRSAKLVAEECVQMHGGIGIADEYRIGHYFKRLLAIDTLFGDADHHAGSFPLAEPAG